MKARTIAIAALLAVMLAAAGWWFGSPWWTLRQVQRAADARDAAALSAYVDYPALRTDVKQQAQRTISQAAATDDPLIALGAAVAGVLVDPAVEALVTPDEISGPGIPNQNLDTAESLNALLKTFVGSITGF